MWVIEAIKVYHLDVKRGEFLFLLPQSSVLKGPGGGFWDSAISEPGSFFPHQSPMDSWAQTPSDVMDKYTQTFF
jgi:hypothetical protein